MSPTKMSKLESAMRVVIEFNQAFNRHDIAGMMVLMSIDCIIEIASPPPDGTVISGADEINRYLQEVFSKSTSIQMKIEEIFGLGERCIMRWRCTWEDEAGKIEQRRGVDIFRVRDGTIHEMLSYVKGLVRFEGMK